MSKVALITGAASGMGLALAKDLLAKDWRVSLLDVSPKGPSITAELGPNAIYHHCDVSSWESQAATFASTFEKWGRIDFAALNAGIDDKDDLYGPTADEKGDPVKPGLKTIDVNLIGVFYGIRLAIHYFRKNEGRGGKIVMTSSDAGLYPLEGVPQYVACKHGLVGITRSMGPVLKKENITINSVLPAFVPTGLAPPGLIEAWPKEHITPMSTVIKCFNMFIEDDEMTGQTGECSQGTVYLRKQPEYANESQRWGREEGGKVWASVYPS
ncbi:NAD(P)-binding protein [Wilcoxina mikolae CBS 423.85]|nr:NAD(P)-binding protein [Wilcoxina mikolae CBS 423.85]